MTSLPNKRKAADAAAGVSEESAPEKKARFNTHPEVGDAKLGTTKTSRTEQLEGANATNAVESQAPWTAMQQLLHARLQQALPNFDGVGGILGIISSYAQGAVCNLRTDVPLVRSEFEVQPCLPFRQQIPLTPPPVAVAHACAYSPLSAL